MITAILTMLAAWFALGFLGTGGHGSWATPGFLLIGIARMLLIAGVVICLLATGIAWCFHRKPETEGKSPAAPGTVAALIIASLSAVVASGGVWDSAFGRGTSGEWSGLGELFVFVIAIPGGISALAMAAMLKNVGRAQRLACSVLAVLALTLPFAMTPLRRARDKRHYNEILTAGRTRKIQDDTPEAGPRSR